MIEEWKPAWGFSRYMISNLGRIRSRENRLYITPTEGKDGSYTVVLKANNGLSLVKAVHRLVADTFLYDPEGYSQVYHIDGNKANNRVDNLRRKGAVKDQDAIVSDIAWKGVSRSALVSSFTPVDPDKPGSRGTPSDRSTINTLPGKSPVRIVRCVNTGEEYPSQSAAARDLGLSQSGISAVLRGRIRHVEGYRFEYVGEAPPSVTPRYSYAARSVRCIDTGEEYPSQGAAARAMGLRQSAISNVLRGHGLTVSGYSFEYVDGGEDDD